MYEVSNEIFDNIKREFMDELNERYYSYNEYAIEAILDEWYDRKQMLLELLSKHPNWDANKLMIRFDEDYSRKINSNVAEAFLIWLRDKQRDNMSYDMYQHMFTLCRKTYVDSNASLDFINTQHESFRFREGMKATKIMKKICSTFGWDKIMETEYNRDGELVQVNAFERQFAQYCDAMCPIKVTRHTCISLNPLDYLLMSNGNSWSSCHDIGEQGDSGCYSSGTISYMLDEHSIIFYTVGADYDGEDIELESKLQRQVFGYNDYQLVQSRLYPQGNDYDAEEIYTDIRNIMQKVMADCLGMPNLWTKKKVSNTYAGSGSTCYQDWHSFSNLCSLSVITEKKDEPRNRIVLGAAPICIDCGDTHAVLHSINCCTSGYVCSECGCRIDNEDDVYWVGDEPYCYDCVTYCDCCNEYYRSDDVYYIASEDTYVCYECRDEYYTSCEHCGTWHNNDDTIYVDSEDKYVCNDCLEEHYEQCADCEEYFLRDTMTEINDEMYCEECAERHNRNEEDEINEEAC